MHEHEHIKKRPTPNFTLIYSNLVGESCSGRAPSFSNEPVDVLLFALPLPLPRSVNLLTLRHVYAIALLPFLIICLTSSFRVNRAAFPHIHICLSL
jgi:hypothetical protein